MDKDQSQVTEKILELTLQIIYLLTGEDCKVVNKSSGKPLTPNHNLNGASPITVPPPHCPTPESKAKKILEVTKQMMELLTGEVPIRCQEVTVYFSMEEWEYLEGHKELYKDVMMASQPALTSPDGPSNGNPPERYPRPLYSQDSSQEHPTIPHHHQGEELKDIKVEDKVKEEKTLPSGDQPSMEEEEMIMENNQMESSLHKDTNGSSNGNPPERCPRPLYSRDSTQEGRTIPHHHQGEDLKDIKAEVKVEEEEMLVGGDQPSMEEEVMVVESKQEESSLQIETNGHKVWDTSEDRPVSSSGSSGKYILNTHPRSEDTSRTTDPSHSKESSLSHIGEHPGESSLSCSVCGKSFTINSDLLIHQRIHTVEPPYSCTECGKRFKQKEGLVLHQAIHTGDRPYLCSECGKCFILKQHLDVHQRLHKGVRPHSCSECDKCFAKRQHLVIHQRVHTGEHPYLCPECGKCFTQQSNLLRHQRIHTGVRPFSCSQCEKSFSDKRNLLNHQKKIHTRDNSQT